MSLFNPTPIVTPLVTWTADNNTFTANSTWWTADGAVLSQGPSGGGNFVIPHAKTGHFNNGPASTYSAQVGP